MTKMLNVLAIFFILIFQIIMWRKVVNLREDMDELTEAVNQLSDEVNDLSNEIKDVGEDKRVERIRNILEAEK